MLNSMNKNEIKKFPKKLSKALHISHFSQLYCFE